MPEETDKELAAISKMIEALKDLDNASKERVIDYVLKRWGISRPVAETPRSSLPEMPRETSSSISRDIRSLKEEKNPKSANEMAALVAFYLTDIASEGERKEAIEKADIIKYFKQANFRLPGNPLMTLAHAKDAGYLDSTGSRGQYKLNPVGYNLVAHGLPQKSGTQRAGPRSVREQVRKTVKRAPKT